MSPLLYNLYVVKGTVLGARWDFHFVNWISKYNTTQKKRLCMTMSRRRRLQSQDKYVQVCRDRQLGRPRAQSRTKPSDRSRVMFCILVGDKLYAGIVIRVGGGNLTLTR